jgi:ribosomal subunit interface protein
MNLTVNGKGIDIGEALQTHVAENLNRVLEKYFAKPIEASATFSREGHQFHVMLSVHAGRGILMQAEGEGTDAYLAFDGAAETLTKRLRRHKKRLRDHHRAVADSYSAKYFVLSAEAEEGGDDGVTANGSDAHEPEAAPAIIAEMQAEIPTLTVGEAVMRLDLADTQAMLFHNRAHGGLNMVYRRNDGNIGWVDPALKPDAAAAPKPAAKTR